MKLHCLHVSVLFPRSTQQASPQKALLVSICPYFMWSSLCPFCPAVMPVPVSLYPVTFLQYLPQVPPALSPSAVPWVPGVPGGSCSGSQVISLRYLRGEDNSSPLFYYLTDFPSAQGNLISSRSLPSVKFLRNGPADIKSVSLFSTPCSGDWSLWD